MDGVPLSMDGGTFGGRFLHGVHPPAAASSMDEDIHPWMRFIHRWCATYTQDNAEDLWQKGANMIGGTGPTGACWTGCSWLYLFRSRRVACRALASDLAIRMQVPYNYQAARTLWYPYVERHFGSTPPHGILRPTLPSPFTHDLPDVHHCADGMT